MAGRVWLGRASKAAISAVENAIMWILVPSFLSGALARYAPSSISLDLPMIFAFGAVITGLMALAALTNGLGVSVPFRTGAYLAEAFYIWTFLDAGVLNIDVSGITITLSFETLVFIMALPSLFNAVRAPLQYLMEESEAVKPITDAV
jgi:hypothetical protein